MKNQDISENQVNTVFLGLGSNLGNRKINLEKAKYLLVSKHLKIISCSNFYESISWPNRKFPKYLNIVIKIKTSLKPEDLFYYIKIVEKCLGRTKSLKNYPRTCDIDILDYDGKCISIISKKNQILIPHPRLHQRSFVLLPLFEISKNWSHPKFKQNIYCFLSKISNIELRSIKLI